MQIRLLGLFWTVGVFAILAESLCAANFDWPQWRGPDRTDVSKETGLLKSWPQDGPKRLWFYDKAGNGYSGPSIANGKYFTIGTRDDSECVIALDANTGKELWVAKLGGILKTIGVGDLAAHQRSTVTKSTGSVAG